MTDQTLDSRLSRIEDSIREIHTVLSGDGTVDGKRGLVPAVVQLIEIVNGNGEQGLRSRIASLEQIELKRSGWINGAAFVGGLIGSAATVGATLAAKYFLR